MLSQVTAIVVVRNGERELATTLAALAAQQRRPDALIVVDCASRDASVRIAQEVGPTQLIRSERRLSFGDAIELAVRSMPPAGGDDVLWLLSHDAAAEPGALAALVGELEVSPSVGVAGPKLLRSDNPDYLIEYGESITRWGATVPLVHDELDQGQHDHLSDVLAVAPAGMLVRRELWTQLGGFDPALPIIDNALDFCVRARLAGHRVSVTPKARVIFGGGGVAGASQSEKWRQRRIRARQARTAQLHRRLAYAPAVLVAVHWLSLLPIALLRSAWLLVMKAPSEIAGEFRAAFAVMCGLGAIARSRSLRRRSQTQRWAAIEPLRIDSAEMRRRRGLEREARLARVNGQRHEIRFFASGGGWVLAGAVLVSVVLFVHILSASAIVGGGLGVLSGSPAELWQNAAYGWRDVNTGFVGAADPFMLVLAVLGTVTFWAPSFSLVLLWLLAIPAAAMSAWFTTARLTPRGGIRALAATLWALAPMLLAALAGGRPGAVIAHILLPLLLLAMLRAARSWSAAAVAALLFAAVAASAPSLIPALLLAWLVLLIVAGRGTLRVLSIPLLTVVLFAPLAIEQFRRGTPIGILADPGLPVSGIRSTTAQLLVGFPTATGWDSWLAALAVPNFSPVVLSSILVIPLLVMGLLGLFLPGFRIGVLSLLLAGAGLFSALAAQQIQIATAGAEQVFLWSGAALSVYWLGLVGAAAAGLRALGRWGPPLTAITSVASVLLVLPLLGSMVFGGVNVSAAPVRTLPAFVAAQAADEPRVTTLQLTPQPSGGVRAIMQHGYGATLDEQSTLAQTSRTISSSQQELARLAGNLVSTSGADTTQQLSELGVQFVLLSPAADPTSAAQAMADRSKIALNEKTTLSLIGETAYGTLWKVATQTSPLAIPRDVRGGLGVVVLVVQLLALAWTILLAIPAGVGRETRPQRLRRRASRTPATASAAAVVAAGRPPLEAAAPGEQVTAREAVQAGEALQAGEAGQASEAVQADAAAESSRTEGPNPAVTPIEGEPSDE